MAENVKSQKLLWQNPVIIAASLATAGVVVFGWWAGTQEVCHFDFWGNRSCSGTKWSAFLEASPNEVGDTLAGFAGALAFVWLIATVVLQGQELREQRQEFEKMADAQESQAKVLAEQQKIFEDEKQQRNEIRARKLLDEKVTAFERYYENLPLPKWIYINVDARYGHSGSTLHLRERKDLAYTDDCVRAYACDAEWGAENLKSYASQNLLIEYPNDCAVLGEVCKKLNEIIKITPDLSDADVVYLKELRLKEFVEALSVAQKFTRPEAANETPH